MNVVVLNNFTGGLSEDPREQKGNTFVSTSNLDTISSSNKLSPYVSTEAEALGTGDITDSLISDFVRASDGYVYAVGRTSTAIPTGTTFFVKSSGTNIASTYNSHASSGAAFPFRANSLVWYINAFYYIGASGTHQLRKLTPPSTFSTAGTLATTASWENELIPRPFVHPLKKFLYASVGQYFARVNEAGTYLNLTSLVLPISQLTSSLTNYGSWLAIGTAPIFTGGRSTVYLWDMAEDRTFNEAIDFGEGSLMILENIGGTLVGVSISDANYSSLSTYTTTQTKKLTIRMLSGGESIIVKELEVPSTFSLKNYKATINGRLYFGGDNSDSLYVIYKDKTGALIVSKDRYIANGTTATTLRGFNIFGDYLFVAYDTASTTGNVFRTFVTPQYNFSSFYESNINPNMPKEDRTKRKQLMSVSVANASATGALSIQVSVDGGAYSTIGTILNKIVNKMTNLSDGNPFESGYEYQFKIALDTGAELTELKYSYEVMAELI